MLLVKTTTKINGYGASKYFVLFLFMVAEVVYLFCPIDRLQEGSSRGVFIEVN
jgi:hypothetical protein